MVDFIKISTRMKQGALEIYPKFIVKKSTDLMIRGGDFYAIWVEERKLWSKDEQDVIDIIDNELNIFVKDNKHLFETRYRIMYMWDSESGIIDSWHKYCQKQMRDNYHMLDETVIFSNNEVTKKDYASIRLEYPLVEELTPSFDTIINTLYLEKERDKLIWSIGAIISGDSKHIQKFVVLYGSAGTGKSTILNIIQKLFAGYYSVFDAKALGSSNNSFALESFKSNPLIAIQHDGDLSRIEDNTRLNSLVSHEVMTVNEKFKSAYANRFNAFLFMGTNKPVKITDAKSGLMRRLIDVSPSGERLGIREYNKLVKLVDFELGGIAHKCLNYYLQNKNKYDDYVPRSMLGASNDFYNFMIDSFHIFKREDGVTLKAAWEMYKTYVDDAKILHPFSQRVFKEELKNYFQDYKERYNSEEGMRVRSYYEGFRIDKFEDDVVIATKTQENEDPLDSIFKEQSSCFDDIGKDYIAQYATKNGTPKEAWSKVQTTLKDLDTSLLHYVKLPENHIVIDFDLKNDSGDKDLQLNIEASSKWPETYSEISKSGFGIHLHYIYTGDTSQLLKIYNDNKNIEIKVSKGGSALRRCLTKNNGFPIATINSGLPVKQPEVKKMIDSNIITTEKSLRNSIMKNLRKEVHPDTRSSIDFIFKILEDAYESGIIYDLSNMKNSVIDFAARSSNQSEYCLKTVLKMRFQSDDTKEAKPVDLPIAFFDIEIFSNLVVLCYKLRTDKKVRAIVNPTQSEFSELTNYNLVGFNNRKYDNHVVYAGILGYSNHQLYELSQKIINSGSGFFGEAYNLSYTDIYDFSSEKKSLKKFEIQYGLDHQELGLPWDEPVAENMIDRVVEYCKADVIATEQIFDRRQSDFIAREILADLAGMTVNDTSNTLTTRIIFGSNRTPQSQFNYRDMGKIPEKYTTKYDDEYTMFDEQNRPIFPGYKYDFGKSSYRDVEEIGEGGRVSAKHGVYGLCVILDIMSMHPFSAIAEKLFGEEYTARFKDLVDIRIAIKHKDYDFVKTIFDGKLAKYLVDEDSISNLSYALKIPINSVYGLTSARFDNPFKDPRNVDNIVAKRGALFMINLQKMVEARGYEVIHIKTDSIKIPDATPEIIDFIMDYGKLYGYTFELEGWYDKIALVNDAVYIAKYKEAKKDKKTGKDIWWTSTGTQFSVPYVFKTLFSKEKVEFEDMCETKSVKTAMYMDMNERLPDVSDLEKERDKQLKLAKKEEYDIHGKPFGWDGMMAKLDKDISKGHDYHFIGKVSSFCPIKKDCDGGILLREKDGNYHAVTGTKGYRWLESNIVKELKKEDDIDVSYYDILCEEAKKSIETYADFEWFVSDEPYHYENNQIIPF